jgi:hypothetical protein
MYPSAPHSSAATSALPGFVSPGSRGGGWGTGPRPERGTGLGAAEGAGAPAAGAALLQAAGPLPSLRGPSPAGRIELAPSLLRAMLVRSGASRFCLSVRVTCAPRRASSRPTRPTPAPSSMTRLPARWRAGAGEGRSSSGQQQAAAAAVPGRVCLQHRAGWPRLRPRPGFGHAPARRVAGGGGRVGARRRLQPLRSAARAGTNAARSGRGSAISRCPGAAHLLRSRPAAAPGAPPAPARRPTRRRPRPAGCR